MISTLGYFSSHESHLWYLAQRLRFLTRSPEPSRLHTDCCADEGLEVKGSVMASDAFFPFRDGIDAAAAAGITAVIQPGGSMRDDVVIAAADEADIAMVFTAVRHFRH